MKNSLSLSKDSGLVAAIWILASNDKLPIMTYQSIADRVGKEIKLLKEIVNSYPELFRESVPQKTLDKWKDKMRNGEQLPNWISSKVDKDKTEAINNLSVQDVFRSQFRAEVDAPKSPIEVINWGLEHIERLRKSEIESEANKGKWFKELTLPALSIIVALLAVIISGYSSCENIKAQKELKAQELEFQKNIKDVELSFNPKQANYAEFLNTVESEFDMAIKHFISKKRLIDTSYRPSDSKRKTTFAFYKLEPFLSETAREQCQNYLNDYNEALSKMYYTEGEEKFKESFISAMEIKTQLKMALAEDLFGISK